MSRITLNPRRNRNRSPFNSSFSTRQVLACDQCGVRFSRPRAAVKARDVHRPDCKHEFCSVECTKRYREIHGSPFDGQTP